MSVVLVYRRKGGMGSKAVGNEMTGAVTIKSQKRNLHERTGRGIWRDKRCFESAPLVTKRRVNPSVALGAPQVDGYGGKRFSQPSIRTCHESV